MTVRALARSVLMGLRNDRDRERWVRERLAEVPAGWRIIDIGAGELRFKAACAHLRYVAQDFGQYDGRGDGRGSHMGTWDQSGLDIVSDLCAIPEPDASFDAALCTEVFEHVPDPLCALREMSRLIRPGGRVILTAPFISYTHFSPYHFSTGFSRYWYEHWLPRMGFRIVSLEPAGDDGFFEFLGQELLRAPLVWSTYRKRSGVLNRAITLLIRAGAAAGSVALGVLHRRSRSSQELITYRWCCVAERVAR